MEAEIFSNLPATSTTQINIQKLHIRRWFDFFDWAGLLIQEPETIVHLFFCHIFD